MRGIVGVLGATAAAGRLIAALARIEAGDGAHAHIATLESGRLARRSAARAIELEAGAGELFGRAGIAWMQTPPASPAPHSRTGAGVAAALSGTVRNLRPLTRRLTAAGRVAANARETDVIEALVALHLERGEKPETAIASTLRHLEGALSIVCVFAREDDLLVGASTGGRLAAAAASHGMMLSSTQAAFAERADQIAVLEPGDIALVTPGRLVILDTDGMRIERAVPQGARATMQAETIERPGV